MEIYQLRSFLVAAEEGNLTRAAARLNTSQPSVSAHIKALEEDFGAPLFERTRHGMLLTQAGEDLHARAERLVAQADELEQLARSRRGEVSGQLRVGVNNQGFGLRLEQVARVLLDRHPRLQLIFENGSSGAFIRNLHGGDLDVAFIQGEVDKAAFATKHIMQVESVIIAARALAGELEAGGWEAIARQPWVFVTRDCSYYRLMQEMEREHGFSLNKRFREEDALGMLRLVESGLAMSMMDRERIRAEGFEQSLSIWDGFSRLQPVNLACRKPRANEPGIRAFFEACGAVHAAEEAG